MSAEPRIEKPDGPMPTSSEPCPKCGAAPDTPHRRDCPWLLWAEHWRKQ